MEYEINVAFRGKHLFATHGRSLKSETEAITLAQIFTEKFPVADGYTVELTKYTTTGKKITF